MGTDELQSVDVAQYPDTGDVVDGRYRLDDVVATGGMGVIMRARQLNLERDVAIKLLHPHMGTDPETVQRFEREVQLAKDLNHPHTIQLLDVGRTDGGSLYVVMEFLDGSDLGEIITDDGPLRMGRALELAIQSLDGLGEAHEYGVVHRDLKPSNIFVQRDRRGDDLVKLLDFGIAKSLEAGSNLTATEQVCGTVEYMPPEALLEQDTGKRGDVYAAGLIIAEMLYAERIFEASSAPQTIVMQLNKDLPIAEPLQGTPLGEVLRRATAKDPRTRFADADEMLEAVEAAAPEMPADSRLKPDEVPAVDVPTGSEVFQQLATGEDGSTFAILEGREGDSGDVVPETNAGGAINDSDEFAREPVGVDGANGAAPGERSESPTQPALPSAPSVDPSPPTTDREVAERRSAPSSTQEVRTRSQKELVGGFSAVVIDNLDNSLLWGVLAVVGIAVTAGVLYVIFSPGAADTAGLPTPDPGLAPDTGAHHAAPTAAPDAGSGHAPPPSEPPTED